MFALATIFALLAAAHAVEFEIINNEPGPVWVGIQGNPGHTHLNNGGVILNQGQSVKTPLFLISQGLIPS